MNSYGYSRFMWSYFETIYSHLLLVFDKMAGLKNIGSEG